MIRSESKRSFCGAGKNNKMATAVRLLRRREVAALFSPSDKILNKGEYFLSDIIKKRFKIRILLSDII